MSKQLPKLSELHGNIEEAFKNDDFNFLMNQPPPASWIKKHPLAKAKNDKGQEVPAEYIPIDKTEFLLRRIFQKYKIEVISTSVMFQSIAVTVRVHYLHPIDGEWYFHDGVGAKSVQTDKGSSASDLGAIKDAGVQMALPSAKSYAIKDACDHLGKLFGCDLNRRNTVAFTGAYNKEEQPKQPETPKNYSLNNDLNL